MRPLALPVCWLLLALTAYAQEYTRVEPAQLRKPETLVNQRIQVEVQFDYETRFGLTIHAHDNGLLFKVAGAELAAKLDALGDENARNCDVRGRIVKLAGEFSFNIEGLEKLPEDIERFHLERAGVDEADAPGLVKLLQRWRLRVEARNIKDEQLLSELAELPGQILSAREAALQRTTDDLPRWLELARDVHSQTGDRVWARNLARVALEITPDHPEAHTLLAELCYVRYQGVWLFEEEYKQAQGFELYQPDPSRPAVWVPSSRVAFLEAVAAQRAAGYPSKRSHPESYPELIESGRIAVGMNKLELIAALGFPDEVDFLRQDERNLELWRYDRAQSLAVYLCSDPGEPRAVDASAAVFRFDLD